MSCFKKSNPETPEAEVWKKLRTVDQPTGLREAMRLVDTGRYVFMTDTTVLHYEEAISCGRYAMAKYTFQIGGLSYAFGKNKPYLKEINYK